MDYVLYLAKSGKGTPIINITHNPWIDFTFLQRNYGIESLNILTPTIPISYAHYIMRNIGRINPFGKIFMGVHRIGDISKLKSIEENLNEFGIKPLKRIKSIDYGEMPISPEELQKIHEVLKGRIMTYSEIKKLLENYNVHYESSLMDILQSLYLEGKLNIYPSIYIERPGKRYICKVCEGEMGVGLSAVDDRCPSCGSYIELDEPIFAVPIGSGAMLSRSVKFKDYKGFTFPQDIASNELLQFAKGNKSECFLWMIPGIENPNIFLRMLRDILKKGRNCAIASSCSDDSLKLYTSIKYAFPETHIVFRERIKIGYGDVAILDLEDIKGCYKAFDLVVLWESFNSTHKISHNHILQGKRALKDGGKIILASFSPDFKMYQRILKKDLELIAIPIGNHGRPMPEPRILTYKLFYNGQYFIPMEVIDFIKWSINSGIRVHIIVPYEKLIRPIIKKLMEIDEIDKGLFQEPNLKILVTEPFKGAFIEEKENVIVLFADESHVFDERTLVNIAGIFQRFADHKYGEVIFVGSKETSEMDIAKQMVRFINKMAWEKGYLK